MVSEVEGNLRKPGKLVSRKSDQFCCVLLIEQEREEK